MFIDTWYKYNFKVNGKQAVFEYNGDSDTEGIISFTYANLGMPHQNHCFYGGNILLGEHKSHSPRKFVPWDGKSKITYTDNKAFVYLTGDVSRSETFYVPGNKELTICLNGHKFKKTPVDDPQGNHVMNINSGGKLRLCGGVYVQRENAPAKFRMSDNSEIVDNYASVAGSGIYIKGVFETTGGTVTNNYSDSEYADMAIEATAEVREGTSLPTEFIDVPSDASLFYGHLKRRSQTAQAI